MKGFSFLLKLESREIQRDMGIDIYFCTYSQMIVYGQTRALHCIFYSICLTEFVSF